MTVLTRDLQSALRRPDFPEYARCVHAAYEEERRRREQFRQELGVKFKHGEFINGEVVLPSPMQLRHRLVIDRLGDLLKAFLREHPIGFGNTDGLLVKTTRNDYEPDVYFWPKSVADTFTPAMTTFPPPTFIAEVLSPGTEERDRGIKFEDYAAHGVAEYWIVDPEAEIVECYDLRGDGRYALREKVSAASGATLRSTAVVGLSFPVAALFDDAANRQTLDSMRAAP